MKRSFTSSKMSHRLMIVGMFVSIQFQATGQVSHAVDVTSNLFTPKEITIHMGDTVIWTNSEGNHNVNGTQATYSSNPESFGNTVGAGWVFSHVFTLPGVYDYQCDPHVRSSMFGKVIVQETPADTLTVIFTGMTPHLGEMLTLFVRDLASGAYLDTLVVDQIEDAGFEIESYVIEPGGTYLIDFYADHNGNGMYDAPPADHSWRLETGEATGNLDIEFVHHAEFTDIFETTGLDYSTRGSDLTIYPNPATDMFKVVSDEAIESVSMISLTGAVIKKIEHIGSSYLEVSLDGIPSGVYIVEVKTSGSISQISRLVKN
jgi:plastocyanin